MSEGTIEIRGAQEHNLKSVDLDLPRHNLVVLTGVSGSGKSSLAFDTVYKEGQRRFLESLSSYARQFLGQMEKPRVEHIAGLSPTVAVDQKTTNRNPRSTVGTITEIWDYLRVLYARAGVPHCPRCGQLVEPQGPDQISAKVLSLPEGTRFSVLAPVVRGRKGEYRENLLALAAAGYVRARIDGEIHSLDEEFELSRYKRHTIEVVIDRLAVSDDPEDRPRLIDSLETALDLGKGLVTILFEEPVPALGGKPVAPEEQEEEEKPKRKKGAKSQTPDDGTATEWFFSKHGGCPTCGISMPELEPRLFSFNSQFGACPTCDGMGSRLEVDPGLLVTDPEKSIRGGALALMGEHGYVLYSRLDESGWEQMAAHFGFSIDTPWKDLAPQHKKLVMYGSGRAKFPYARTYYNRDGKRILDRTQKIAFAGLIPTMRAAWDRSEADHIKRFMSHQVCSKCGGTRLRPEALAVTFHGLNISELGRMSVIEMTDWEKSVDLEAREAAIAGQLLREIRARLGFLRNVGLNYLTLSRTADTLAGGEAQRLRLAAQLGAGLEGVLYVLDEPSIGLHHRDNNKLLDTLSTLRDRGNSLLVVEHDEETIRRADWVVDFGPGAGRLGGNVVAEGTPADISRSKLSLTGQYLRHELSIPVPAERREGSGLAIRVVGAREHNLQDVTVDIPLGKLVVVTGVSGSGKSTLVDDILKRALARTLHNAQTAPGAHERIEGIENIDKVIEIDQGPIGRTPRSNPATYTGVFDHIRTLYTTLPDSKIRGYKPGRFSFNVPGGRCEACSGSGVKVVEMQFLANVEVPCEVCGGKRFNNETLRVRFKDRTISDVLEMSAVEARELFAVHPAISRILQTLIDVGLGYITLGQSSTTLSGGEAQRIKLAEQLARPSTGRTLYLLDEPTTGLHFADVARLLDVVQRLVDAGNSVLVVEHNPDVIKVADHIIDLGPEGGSGGGQVIATGTPEQVAKCEQSYTGRMLIEVLSESAGVPSSNGSGNHATRLARVAPEDRKIVIRGAKKHNLKNIDVDIPKRKLVVVTGVSGSGKSSLAMDTIFAEGQRRFVECLSSYARQFLGRLDDAAVERIEGLAPAIAIDQKYGVRSPRSTVATSTELYDYMRLLWARLGRPFCPNDDLELVGLTSSQIVQKMLALPAGTRAYLLAPVQRGIAGDCVDILAELFGDGYARAWVDGKEVELSADPQRVPGRGKHNIDVVIDRIVIDPESTGRIADSVELSLAKGDGVISLQTFDANGKPAELIAYSRRPSCPKCGLTLEEPLTPRLFSPNYHAGACDTCKGLGFSRMLSADLVIPDPNLSYMQGAIALIPREEVAEHRLTRILGYVARRRHIDLNAPWRQLPEDTRNYILYGDWPSGRGKRGFWRAMIDESEWPGIIPRYTTWYEKTKDPVWAQWLEGFMSEQPCPDCDGEKLKPLYRAVRLGGQGIGAVGRMSVQGAREFFAGLDLTSREARVAEQALKEISDRLGFLSDVGLDYLTLDRLTSTLSGGEAQRIRLATQVGARLVDALYVLDEPSIGLHQRDVGRLMRTLSALRNQGNTVIVVEHDEEIIRAADHILDIGPGPGRDGGELIAQGTLRDIEASERSLTGAYLRGDERVNPVESNARPGDRGWMLINGATEHNLKDIDIALPLGQLVVVTGVSGSGKSTLVNDILEAALSRKLNKSTVRVGAHRSIEGMEKIDRVIAVDQHAIGRTSKSNPATYTGVFDPIRELFAEMPESKIRGYTAGRFSFNDARGWCPSCMGEGVIKVSMQFLADVEIPCETCGGRRYNIETLSIRFNGQSIADVLEMRVDEALEFFRAAPHIRRTLQVLHDVGLGYMQLGQPSGTLSGGEAQRVKLATELCKSASGHAMYILDEPTVGLHFADVARLLGVLRRLINAGHSVIVVEHNLDMIAAADFIIDLGPEGGDAGGYLVAAGTPAGIAGVAESFTGQYLKGKLAALGDAIIG